MITTLLLDILNFFWYGLVELLWPRSIAGFDLNLITSAFTSLVNSITPILRIADILIPIPTIITFAILFLTLYVIFFIFKIGRMILSILTRSGG